MAIGTPVVIGTASDTASNTSLAITVGAGGVPFGSTIIVDIVLGGANDTSHGCADSASNAYVPEVVPTEVTPNLNGRRFRCFNSAALSAGQTITVSWTGVSAPDAAKAYYITGLALTSPQSGTPTGAEQISTPISSGALTTSTGNSIILGFCGRRGLGSDGFTEDAAFTTLGGAVSASTGVGNSSRILHSAYRIVSASETRSYGPSLTTSRNWAAGISAYRGLSQVASSVGASAGVVTVAGVGQHVQAGAAAAAGAALVEADAEVLSTGESSYRSHTTTNWALTANTVVAAPADVAAGDTVLLYLILGNATGLPVTPTLPEGFEVISGPATVIDAGNFRVTRRLARKVATSAEPASYTIVHAQNWSQAVAVCVAGGDTTVSPVVTDNSGTGSTTTALGLETLTDNGYVGFLAHNWDLYGAGAPPTGDAPTFTERLDAAASLVYVADGVLTAAGATGNKTHGNTNTTPNAPWAAYLVHIPAGTVAAEEAVGSAAGTGAATANSVVVAAAAGASVGAVAGGGVGSGVSGHAAVAAGTSTATATGTSRIAAAGAAVGQAMAAAVATAFVLGSAGASGATVVTATAQPWIAAIGASVGASVGGSVGVGGGAWIGESAGTSFAVAPGQALAAAALVADGQAAVFATGTGGTSLEANSIGLGTATAEATATAGLVGDAAGLADVAATGAAGVSTGANAAGVGQAHGAGLGSVAAVGASVGQAAAVGAVSPLQSGEAIAGGSGQASATGVLARDAAGVIVGAAAVLGVTGGIAAGGVGLAGGTATTVGIWEMLDRGGVSTVRLVVPGQPTRFQVPGVPADRLSAGELERWRA